MAATGESRGTVQRVKKMLNIPATGNKGGRPKALTKRDEKYIVQAVTIKGKENAVEATHGLEQDLGKSVSVHTVRRALRRAGLVSFVKPKKPLLTAKHKKDRLQWAYDHISWTLDDWKRVVWSDETRINRFGSDGKAYAWKMPGEPLQSQHVRETVKHGGGCIMVWSCITWYGPGYIVDVGHNMDKFIYLSVLQDDLVKTMAEYIEKNPQDRMDFSRFVFMQDNDPKHKSKIVREWLAKQSFRVMEWPAQSPDLNPIENMWDLLKRRLFKGYDKPPAGMNELWERVSAVWYAIAAEECQKYIRTMHRRCQAVIDANGGYIDF